MKIYPKQIFTPLLALQFWALPFSYLIVDSASYPNWENRISQHQSLHILVCYAPVFCLLCGRIKGQLLLLPLSLLLKDRVLIILSFSWIDFSLLLSLNINVQNYGQFFFSIYYLLFFKFIRLFLMLILIYNKPSSIPFMLLIIPPIPISLISFMTNDSKNCEYWFFF